MKTNRFFPILIAIITIAFSMQSCEKTDDTQMGSLDFGMSPAIESALKSVDSYDRNVIAALVTIVNDDSVKVYDKEYIEFYGFGDSYVTKSLSLNVGNYQLKEFLLLDSSKNVIWATPVEGSTLASMVNDPLPMFFEVFPETTTHLFPQVVRAKSYTPEDFGYVIFNVDFVENFCINVFFESFCDEWYYDSVQTNTNADFAPFYPARIEIYSEGEFLSETFLDNGENKVPIPRSHKYYKLLVFNCANELCFSEAFGLEELKMFSCVKEKPLYITCESNHPDSIQTPEGILKPTIEQGVFGKITSSKWDSINYEDKIDSLFQTELYIYDIDQGDSLIYSIFGSDCIAYPEIYIKPLVVVRTNTSGIYQAPLEEGTYNYLVRTEFGYYLDAYISSRVPGMLEVKNGEVTILNIDVNPCAFY